MRSPTTILVASLFCLAACAGTPPGDGSGEAAPEPETTAEPVAEPAAAIEEEADAGAAAAAPDTLPSFDRMWVYSDPARTEGRFRELLDRVECDAGDDYLAQLLSQIARAEGLQAKFDDAHATLDRVEAQLPYATAVARSRYLLERGRAFNSGGKPEESIALFEEALEVARSSEDESAQFHAVDAAHMLGIVVPGEKGLAWNRTAIELAEAATYPPAKGWVRALYHNTGWTYHDMGRFEEALELWNKELTLCPDDEGNRITRIARWTIGRGLRSLGRVEEALEIQRALETWYVEHGGSTGYTEEEIAECLLALGREDDARPYFAAAHRLLSEKQSWMLDEKPERMARLKKLGDDS